MNALHVTTPTGPAGTLSREAGQYQFVYTAQADAAQRGVADAGAAAGAAAIGRVFVSREGAVQETLAEHRALAGGVEGVAILSRYLSR